MVVGGRAVAEGIDLPSNGDLPESGNGAVEFFGDNSEI